MQAIKQFFKTHPHAWWGAYLPVYLAMFFTIEHFITDNYWATQTVLDTYIPFCEWFIFPYVSWSPLLVVLGIYLILKDAEGFRRYMWFIMVTFTTAVVFCILVPNGQDLRPAVMLDDVAGVRFDGANLATSKGTPAFTLKNVTGLAIHNSPGLPETNRSETITAGSF